MALDLEEQEQMDNLKAFWDRWGALISGLLISGVLTFAGWKGYGYYLNHQSEKAAAAYDSYLKVAQKKDASADAALAVMQQNYGKTQYAALASVQAAQVAMTAQQWDKAIAPLQWLVANGTPENQGVARLMLADVLAQQSKPDEALKILETLPNANFKVAFANKKSDIYLQMKDLVKARENLNQALKLAKEQGVSDKDMVDALQLKLDLLPSL